MMTSLDHEVIIYSGEENDAPCAEHVTCITKDQQAGWMNVHGPEDILAEPFVHQTYLPSAPWWPRWNAAVIEQMTPRVQPHDFVCLIGGGILFEPLIAAFRQQTIAVEYAIGYAGVSANTWHAFGSDAWRNVVFGLQRYEGWRGRAYDRTIPHYFDLNDFEYRTDKSDYLLYLGKLKFDKGVGIASRTAEHLGERIIFAGQGPTPIPYGEVLNRRIGPEERKELLAGAKAVFVPSLYTEPFGMITVEALLSGTPVITTAFGALPELNLDGVTGFVCNTFRDFVDAAKNIDAIDPAACRMRGMDFAQDRVRHQYQRWFDDLAGLWGQGWGAT